MRNLTGSTSRGKARDLPAEQLSAKRQWLESKMQPEWDRALSLQIDHCLALEESLHQCPSRTVAA